MLLHQLTCFSSKLWFLGGKYRIRKHTGAFTCQICALHCCQCTYRVVLKYYSLPRLWMVFYIRLLNPVSLVVSNDALRGSTPQAGAQVLQWISFADSEIVPPASAWVFPTLGIMQFNKQVCRYCCWAFGIGLVIFFTGVSQFYRCVKVFAFGHYVSRPQNRQKRR